MDKSSKMDRNQPRRIKESEKRVSSAKIFSLSVGLFVLFLCNATIGCHSFVPPYSSWTMSSRISMAGIKDDGALSSSLSERIRQLQEKEAAEENRLAMRIKGLQKSQELQDMVESEEVQQVELPVVSFDSLLPKQRLEGRTDDPTFCRFLQKVGLGGWFVMTSLDTRQRKLRRHGVLAKIEVIDDGAIYYSEEDQKQSNSAWIPTAVDFCISGHSRCRIVGARQGMQARIGRWRRGHDPDGEESVLGWGEERFVDAPDELAFEDISFLGEGTTPDSPGKGLPYIQWNSVLVECNLESREIEATPGELEKMQELIPLVEEWYALASNAKTYTNLNVTAATRVMRDQPGLLVDPEKLLQRVVKELGPQSKDNPTAFSFWAAALINPLPVLGVSMEIRGRLLEAPTTQERLKVLEFGLQRSIDNLTGQRPL
jgi:hypothetical protein